ncbi:sulfite exporter TauE/SafE family protein [Emcibacteraceae bacterium]|nr:sulfite exporter TauE/SafE family protein [Emcibacteraceae bacterium]
MIWALLFTVTFVASAVQSATGFAFALIIVPAYLFLLGTTDVIQIAIILSVVISTAHLSTLKLNIPRQIFKWLAIGCAFGLPGGLYLYSNINLALLKILVAVFIIFISIQNGFNMFKKTFSKAYYNKLALTVIGALSGMLGSSMAMPGPLVMLYLSRTTLSKDEIRASMVLFFVFTYIAILILQVIFIGVEHETWITSAYLAPAALCGVFVGHQISKKINEMLFKVFILIILIITGCMMLINL